MNLDERAVNPAARRSDNSRTGVAAVTAKELNDRICKRAACPAGVAATGGSCRPRRDTEPPDNCDPDGGPVASMQIHSTPVAVLYQREPMEYPSELLLPGVGSVVSSGVERAMKLLLIAKPPAPVGPGVTTCRPL